MSGGMRTQVGENSTTTISLSLLGDPGSGKTSMKNYLLGKEFNSNERITIGAQFSFTKLKELNDIRLKIADIAGQVTFDAVRHRFLMGSDAALIVFDLTNPQSLKNVHGWLHHFLKANKNKEQIPPILLVGNKTDLERKVPLSTVKDFLQLIEEDFSTKSTILDYIETSAKTGENIEYSFDKLAKIVIGN